MDQLNLSAWVGRRSQDTGAVSESLAAQLDATLGPEDATSPCSGQVLAPLAHWCAFTPIVHMSELSADGHPHVGDLLPPVRLPRRMWVGGALRFLSPLRVGDPLERRSSLRNVIEKETANGPAVFVTVDHAIYGPKGLAIEERQDIAYLEIPDTYRPPQKRAMPGSIMARVEMNEALLFRYSALTFNAHRIHYDRQYAQAVEKYPDLVIHGPLQASVLMRAAIAHRGRPPSDFHYRGVHPMFCGSDLEIAIVEDGPALSLYTGQSGHQGMQATAIWEETQ